MATPGQDSVVSLRGGAPPDRRQNAQLEAKGDRLGANGSTRARRLRGAAGAAVALAAILLGTLLASLLGGKAGRRYHHRVDRAGYDR